MKRDLRNLAIIMAIDMLLVVGLFAMAGCKPGQIMQALGLWHLVTHDDAAVGPTGPQGIQGIPGESITGPAGQDGMDGAPGQSGGDHDHNLPPGLSGR